jgi:hypothetical protein
MIYVNKKNQKRYIVLGIGFHTELEELTVRYSPLYECEYTEFYRPLEGESGFKHKFKEYKYEFLKEEVK